MSGFKEALARFIRLFSNSRLEINKMPLPRKYITKSALALSMLIVAVIAIGAMVIEPLCATAITAFPKGKAQLEKDSAGREWVLKQWEKNTRPYPFPLPKREDQYRQQWGENWNGPVNGRRIHNPGNWLWEIVATAPSELAASLASTEQGGRKFRTWGSGRVNTFVWAPSGGAVTDIYALTKNGVYHYEPTSQEHLFIGNPEKSGLQDGIAEKSLLEPGAATLDPVTGRLYFLQTEDRKKRVWRYIEKLLPYRCTLSGKTFYLPAALDSNELYRRVKSPVGGDLRPLFEKDGKRAEPHFVVRSNPAQKTLHLPGAYRGKRPLITPDGKGVYFATNAARGKALDTLTSYDKTVLFDIETGEMTSEIRLQEDVPKNFSSGSDGPGSHGGNNVGYDGLIYTSQHGGSGGGPGRMFSINPKTGIVAMLYDSIAEDGAWKKRRSPVIDGPADALSLDFTSTLWQVQCPRTGAIINGGWDNSGIRRYHDGFVTTIVNGDQQHRAPPRPGWQDAPIFIHNNSNPSIAPNGDLYIADVNSNAPRIIRIYRTDWPKEQPVNGYAERFLPKEKMDTLVLEYAQRYIENYAKNNRFLGSND